MTSYVAIPNGDIDQDSPATQPLFTAIRDNPIAISEGSANAPVLSTGWHPYNMVNVGDGNTGLIYDQTIDGTVASVITPDFVNGYEYLIRFDGVSLSAAAAFRVDLYKETDAAYQALTVSGNSTDTVGYSGLLRIVFPRIAKRAHIVTWETSLSRDSDASDLVVAGTSFVMADITLQTILRARIQGASGNIDLGKIYLYRQREFITG